MLLFKEIILLIGILLLPITIALILYETCCLKKIGRWWANSDFDIKIIGIAPIILLIILCLIFYMSDTSKSYKETISLMIQLSGVSLGLVAATIAFRNYRRKSGDKLSFFYWTFPSGEVSYILLHNEKDKLVTVFAIDLVFENNQRIRFIDLHNPMEAITLSAFESKEISFKPAHNYGGKPPSDFYFKKIHKAYCITSNGEIPLSTLNLEDLNDDYLEKNNISRAYRPRFIPKQYLGRKIDLKAQFWLTIEELKAIGSGLQLKTVNHILTGYIQKNRFSISDESLNYMDQKQLTTLKKHLIKTVHNVLLFEHDYDKFNMYYAWDYPDEISDSLRSELNKLSHNSIKIINMERIWFHNSLYENE